jgi:hypothetical protein
MLTDDLTEALSDAAAHPPFPLNITDVLARSRQLRRRRRTGITVVVAGIAGLSVLGALVVAPALSRPGLATDGHRTPIGVPHPITGAEALAAFSHWGPTRGSLAHDHAFLANVQQEWAHPTGPEAVSGPNTLTGSVRVLFAGQTPGGPAAVVTQDSTDRHVGLEVGVMTTVPGQGLSLWGPNDPSEWSESDVLNEGRFDTRQVSFTSGSGHAIVVLPTNPSDTVSASVGHSLDRAGRAVRAWKPVATVAAQPGVAIVPSPHPDSSWDTLIRVSRAGRLIDQGAVWINVGSPPVPTNALGTWTQINAVVGKDSGGTSVDTFAAWARLHGAADEPFGQAGWDIEGQFPDGSFLLIEQLWLYGDPAHTVILRENHNTWQVLSDTVTNRRARPLFAVRSAVVGGWLVAAGPRSIITGYRTPGSRRWIAPRPAIRDYSGPNGNTPQYSRKAAYLPTLAPTLQIRLVVNGKNRVVTTARPTNGR